MSKQRHALTVSLSHEATGTLVAIANHNNEDPGFTARKVLEVAMAAIASCYPTYRQVEAAIAEAEGRTDMLEALKEMVRVTEWLETHKRLRPEDLPLSEADEQRAFDAARAAIAKAEGERP